MISLSGAVHIIIYLLIAAAVFGLLYLLIVAVGRIFPGEASNLFVRVAQLVLLILAILVLLGLLLSHVGGVPVFRE